MHKPAAKLCQLVLLLVIKRGFGVGDLENLVRLGVVSLIKRPS